MKNCIKFLISAFVISAIFTSCTKKPLTLDDSTSMKTLLKASDKEITELVIQEASQKAGVSAEKINVEYIYRDKENQAIVVKSKIDEE